MGKKKAVSYYFNVMDDNKFSDFKFYETGKDAVEGIKKLSKTCFQLPFKQRNSMKLTHKNSVTIGFPFRKLVARFLTEDEIKVIDEFKEHSVFDIESERFVYPNEQTLERINELRDRS